jgi:hypothetical protein
MLWAYIVDIYEPSVGYHYPVVQHVFLGKTRQEAWGYYKAHLTTDEFLAGCVEKGRWQKVSCSARAGWQRI